MADNRTAELTGGVDGQGEGGPGRPPTSRCRCVELCGSVGYSEGELLEKWARDSKILDIFEGTQQIQQLIVARRVLGLSSAELK
ncbi:MAG: acyl-CoA dehydrogenase family protein [Nocardioides sp.]